MTPGRYGPGRQGLARLNPEGISPCKLLTDTFVKIGQIAPKTGGEELFLGQVQFSVFSCLYDLSLYQGSQGVLLIVTVLSVADDSALYPSGLPVCARRCEKILQTYIAVTRIACPGSTWWGD